MWSSVSTLLTLALWLSSVTTCDSSRLTVSGEDKRHEQEQELTNGRRVLPAKLPATTETRRLPTKVIRITRRPTMSPGTDKPSPMPSPKPSPLPSPYPAESEASDDHDVSEGPNVIAVVLSILVFCGCACGSGLTAASYMNRNGYGNYKPVRPGHGENRGDEDYVDDDCRYDELGDGRDDCGIHLSNLPHRQTEK